MMTEAESSLGNRAHAWWQRYCGPEASDPGSAARLRRCRSTLDAIQQPAAIDLVRRLGGMRAQSANAWVDRTLDLARVLAHVRRDLGERPMRVVGWSSFPGGKGDGEAPSGERPVLSDVRFRRLLDTPVGEPLVSAFVRLVRLMGGEANVRALAADFLYWNDQTKKQWAFDYYAAGMAAPPTDPSIQETDA